MVDICEIIKDAECCAAKMAHKYSIVKSFGNEDDELFNSLMLINAYIRTLKRNVPETYTEKIPIPIESTDLSSLKRQNNVLILDIEQKYECVEKKTEVCLTDDEICRMYEEIKVICSLCNCNCN